MTTDTLLVSDNKLDCNMRRRKRYDLVELTAQRRCNEDFWVAGVLPFNLDFRSMRQVVYATEFSPKPTK